MITGRSTAFICHRKGANIGIASISSSSQEGRDASQEGSYYMRAFAKYRHATTIGHRKGANIGMQLPIVTGRELLSACD